MEIVIDAALVRSILEREYGQARKDLRAVGALPALERSQQRHDERIAAAPDVGTLDCRAGCTWCCHFSVDVRAVEVFAIVEFVERNFSVQDLARLRAELAANSAALRDLDDLQRMTRNVRCAFLADGRCSIYPVRPQTCRNYHATNVAGCRQSFEQPENLDIDPDFAPEVYQAGGAHVEAFSAALRESGYDTNAYELNAAVDAAWSDPGARQRFEAGIAPFPALPGEDVPGEFEELAK